MGIRNAMARTPGHRALTLALSLSVFGLLLCACNDAGAHGVIPHGQMVQENTGLSVASSSALSSQSSDPDIPAPKYSLSEIPQQVEVSRTDRLAINASGDVAGVRYFRLPINSSGSGSVTGAEHATGGVGIAGFLYHLGKITDLLPGGDPTSKIKFISLNDRGDVLLTRTARYSQERFGQPYIWHDGHFTSVGPVPKDLKGLLHEHRPHSWPVVSVVVSAMNNAGQVTGYFVGPVYASDVPQEIRPFLWQNGVFSLLPNKLPITIKSGMSIRPGMTSDLNIAASAMNNRGLVIGVYHTGGAFSTALPRTRIVIWQDGIKRIIEVRSKYDESFGKPDAASAPIEASDNLRPAAINDLGQWVGVHDIDDDKSPIERACLWLGEDTSAVRDLPLLSVDAKGMSRANAINNTSQIVGTVVDAREWDEAYLWQDGGKAYDLNDLIDKSSGIHLMEAASINDSGQIVAVGIPEKGNGSAQHVYILTPVKQ